MSIKNCTVLFNKNWNDAQDTENTWEIGICSDKHNTVAITKFITQGSEDRPNAQNDDKMHNSAGNTIIQRKLICRYIKKIKMLIISWI